MIGCQVPEFPARERGPGVGVGAGAVAAGAAAAGAVAGGEEAARQGDALHVLLPSVHTLIIIIVIVTLTCC